jgi:hypothetical protein
MVGTWERILLLLPLLSAGVPSHDLASVLEPAAYLKAHDLEPTAGRLAELATKQPRSGQEQMTQLLAIRWLGAHADEAKKAAGALDALRAVAAGEKGRDPHGFARDHAARALARIEGRPAPAGPVAPAASVRGDALSWFPVEATVFGAMDLRWASGRQGTVDPDALSTALARLAPEPWKEIFDFADAVGNLRLDRLALAIELDAKGIGPNCIWIRLTGACEPKWLEAFVAKNFPERIRRTGPRGEPVVILHKQGSAPAFALIGQTDFVIAGRERDRDNHAKVVEALLDARAGKGKNVTTGPFAEVLDKTSDKAQGLFVADVPQTLGAQVLRGSPLPAAPRRVLFEVVGGRAPTARVPVATLLTVRVVATMKDEEEAAATAKAVAQWKDQFLRALKDLPPDAQAPRELVDVGKTILEAVRITTRGSAVTVTAPVPVEAARAALQALQPAAPPPPKAP